MDHDRTAVPPSNRSARRAAALALVAAAGVNGGCETSRIPGVYRMDIQQGNAVDREMLDRIEIGMDRSKVRFILGTPLLVDPFHQDRWDYIYSFRTGSEPSVSQRVSLYFADDRLVRIEDHLAPGGVPGVASERIQTLVTVPKRRTRKGFLDVLVPDFIKRDERPEDDPAADNALPAKAAAEDAGTTPSGPGTDTTSSE